MGLAAPYPATGSARKPVPLRGAEKAKGQPKLALLGPGEGACPPGFANRIGPRQIDPKACAESRRGFTMRLRFLKPLRKALENCPTPDAQVSDRRPSPRSKSKTLEARPQAVANARRARWGHASESSIRPNRSVWQGCSAHSQGPGPLPVRPRAARLSG